MSGGVITQQRLRNLLSYNRKTGLFTWRVMHSHSTSAGMAAGSKNTSGHIKIQVDGHPYLAHRLVWLYVYGRWPACQIDHRNGLRDDNRFANLREATHAENSYNRKLMGRSGIKGVSWNGRSSKWQARITVGGRELSLGYFATLEEAGAAYVLASREYHGEFGRIR